MNGPEQRSYSTEIERLISGHTRPLLKDYFAFGPAWPLRRDSSEKRKKGGKRVCFLETRQEAHVIAINSLPLLYRATQFSDKASKNLKVHKGY